ncbi:hypothetical protein BG74_09440 [Sodalis-like endosymbiont of Proechinophthirus fluctus]|nr:hypothetical protein BG74_09440 [Sodalis-like endosymbiont of Proechinophthirus fluctus]
MNFDVAHKVPSILKKIPVSMVRKIMTLINMDIGIYYISIIQNNRRTCSSKFQYFVMFYSVIIYFLQIA